MKSAPISPKTAFLVTRSVIPSEADRAAFDQWYSTDHMPKAIRLFGCEKAWRMWSLDDLSVHCAVYQFADSLSAQTRDETARQKLIAEYDAAWPGISRTREILELVDEFTSDDCRNLKL